MVDVSKRPDGRWLLKLRMVTHHRRQLDTSGIRSMAAQLPPGMKGTTNWRG